MKIVILVPFRPDVDGWREAAFNRVLPQIKSLGLPYYVADSGDEPFSIGRTWNEASDLADVGGRWDIAIRWAADMMLTDVAPIAQGLRSVRHYLRPFDSGIRLSSGEAHRLWASGEMPQRVDASPFGGISINTRGMWETVGGFDPRFVGWGHEDRAFMHGVAVNFGRPDRVPGRIIQFWHPRRRRGEDSTLDPYWGCREANHDLYAREIKPIRTAAEWATYLDNRDNTYRYEESQPLT